MTLPSIPPLSMSQIAAELNVALPISLNDANARALAAIPTGAISILDFLGRSASLKFNIIVGFAIAGFLGSTIRGWRFSTTPTGSCDNLDVTGLFNSVPAMPGPTNPISCNLAMNPAYPRLDGKTITCGGQSETLVYTGQFGLGSVYEFPTMNVINSTPEGGSVHAEIS